MDSLIHADIFFFITSIVVVVVSVLFCIALFYVISILRDIREIARRAKGEAIELMDDIGTIRKDVRETVESGIAKAKGFSQMVQPSTIMEALRFLFKSIVERGGTRTSEAPKRRSKPKPERPADRQ